jgi:hypothetical protein
MSSRDVRTAASRAGRAKGGTRAGAPSVTFLPPARPAASGRSISSRPKLSARSSRGTRTGGVREQSPRT